MKGCAGCKWENRPTFAYDADITVYWPEVRPCWEEENESVP